MLARADLSALRERLSSLHGDAAKLWLAQPPTTVTLDVPFSIDDDDAPAAEADEDEPPETRAAARAGRRMTTAVIAEDEKLLAAEIREELAKLWPELDVRAIVHDGHQALREIEAHRPDVLFLDIQMPGPTGIEVARFAGGRAHVVFITAYDQYAVQAFEEGAVDYLLKPIDPARLARALRRVKDRLAAPPADLSRLLEQLQLAPSKEALRWITVLQGPRGHAHHGRGRLLLPGRHQVRRRRHRRRRGADHDPLQELVAQAGPGRLLADPPQHDRQRQRRTQRAAQPRRPSRAAPEAAQRDLARQQRLRAPVQAHVTDMRRPDPELPRPPRSRTLARSAWSALGCLASLAAAQDASRLDRVEITGSRLSQLDAETALPVVVIRREQIERSGATTAEELLTRLSASVLTDKEASRVGSPQSPGYSGLSIRGFGGAGTLVLVDGRRLANYPFSAGSSPGVDLNAIPFAAIERVEILKDGASAIYGSDALGGVVNFILKKDFRGGAGELGGGGSEDVRRRARECHGAVRSWRLVGGRLQRIRCARRTAPIHDHGARPVLLRDRLSAAGRSRLDQHERVSGEHQRRPSTR